MKIESNKLVSITYTLTVDGAVVETVTNEKPLEFPYGAGFMLPKFEEMLVGKAQGDKFEFTLGIDDAYGDVVADMIVELPKNVFEVEGVVNEEMLATGSLLPMMDSEGNRLMGTVKENKDDVVLMDFNHPMAGKSLSFVGEVVSVGELTPEKLAEMTGGGGGCCGSGGCDDGGCGDGGCGDGGCADGGCGDDCKCDSEKDSCCSSDSKGGCCS